MLCAHTVLLCHWLSPHMSALLQVVVIVEAVTVKASEIAAVKDDAEKDLAAAKPALDSALSALNSITQKDIVKRIFDCVLLLR